MNLREQFIDILRIKYGLTLDTDVYTRIDNWKAWFDGLTLWHVRTIDTGVVQIKNKVVSLNLALNICRDRAAYTISENINISLNNEKDIEYLDDILNKLNFKKDIVSFYERILALGTSATEIVGDALFDDKGFISIDNLDINYIQSDAIYPLSFSGNNITEVAFAFNKSYKDTQIIDLRLHLLNEDGTYRIENHRYILSKNTSWKEWDILDGEELRSDYVPVINTNLKIPFFQIWNTPETDPHHAFGLNPLGVLIFDLSLDLLKQLDLAVDTLLRDVALGLPLILCSTSLLPEDVNHPQRRASPDDLRQSMYQWIQTDSNDTDPYRVITHDLNSDKIILLIDKLILLISDNCGLGLNFYSNNKINKTATEILVDNLTLERSIKRSIVYIKNLIKQLCKTLLYIGKFYNGLNELSYGDDIVIDIKFSDELKERYEKEQLRQDVIDGIIPKEVYIQKYYPDLNINEIQDNNKLT